VTMTLTLGGAIGVTLVRAWAYRASPKAPRGSDAAADALAANPGEFRRRLVVYYAALALFVLTWIFFLSRNQGR
jgi:hypothetical protein